MAERRLSDLRRGGQGVWLHGLRRLAAEAPLADLLASYGVSGADTDLLALAGSFARGPEYSDLLAAWAEGEVVVRPAEALRWVAGAPPAAEFEAEVKIRYRAEAQPAQVRVTADGADVRFRTPQRAVAPGQAVVLYRDDEVLGGGIISSASPA